MDTSKLTSKRTAAGKRIEEISSDARWFVVHSQPHKELYAATNLERQGFTIFVPRMKKTVRHARQTKQILAPLFPRYLFVSLDLEHDPWRSVLGTFGVTSMIMNGERPRPVPPDVVEPLQMMSAQFGQIDFRQELKCGQKVRFVAGPLVDRIGKLSQINDGNRVAVLLEIMGAERELATSPDVLVPALV